MLTSRKILGILILILTLIHLAVPVEVHAASFDGSIPPEAWSAAEQGLRMFRSQSMADPEKWGFASTEEAERLTLGEGYRIAYIGKSAYSTSDMTSLLATEDSSLYPTWLFTVDLDQQPRSFVFVCRPAGEECQFAGFGGDSRYFGIARSSLQKASGTASGSILMQRGPQYFLVLKKDGRESVLPVPYDQNSQSIVESGQGFVDPEAVIQSIQAEPLSDSEAKLRGYSYLDVWKSDDDTAQDANAPTIAIACSAALGGAMFIAGVLIRHARLKRRKRRGGITFEGSSLEMSSVRPRRRVEVTNPTKEGEWSKRQVQDETRMRWKTKE